MVVGGWHTARAPGALGKREMTVASLDPEKLRGSADSQRRSTPGAIRFTTALIRLDQQRWIFSTTDKTGKGAGRFLAAYSDT